MKRGTISHPKTQILAELLGIPVVQAVGHLEMLWHFTAAYAPDGAFRGMSRSCVAQRAGWEGDPNVFIRALVDAKAAGHHGFLEEHRELGLVVHDWSEHADDTVQKWLAARGRVFWDGREPYSRRKRSPSAGYGEAPFANDSRALREGFTNDSSQPEPKPLPEPLPKPLPRTKSVF